MALSLHYSNWEAMDPFNSNLAQFYDHQSEVTDTLIGLYDPIDIPIDSLFDSSPPDDLFNNYNVPPTTSNLPPSYSEPSIISLQLDIYQPPIDDLDYFQCPKRPRSCSDLYQPPVDIYNRGFVGPEMNSWSSVELNGPQMEKGEKKTNGTSSGGAGLSAQSVAARERRKRISEKTQELGRLIPGGTKMNTAEMFQAAFKYVKFLQAQVGILGLMGSIQGGKGSPKVAEDLQLLIKSQMVQEKLYGEGRCIILKEVVHGLAKDSLIKSSPLISRDLDRLVESMGSKSGGR